MLPALFRVRKSEDLPVTHIKQLYPFEERRKVCRSTLSTLNLLVPEKKKISCVSSARIYIS